MSKDSLFDTEESVYGSIPVAPARARNSDPETSHEAAAKHNRSGNSAKHCIIVLRLVRLSPGLTAVELHASQDVSDLERHEISRRLSDLERAGQVQKGPERKCEIRGTSMVTWYSVEQPQ